MQLNLNKLSNKKVAIVTEHITQYGGGEKVVQSILKLFPEAPLFVAFANFDLANKIFPGHEIHTSHLQKFARFDKVLLPFIPGAYESFNLKEFDLIISITSGFAKNIICPETAVHICYMHTPPRYLWSEPKEYIESLTGIKKLLGVFAGPTISKHRVRDFISAQLVDGIIANSNFIKQRINKYYKRDSLVIYPPVETVNYISTAKRGDYYVTGGRMVSYKRFDLAIEAFNYLKLPLFIWGSGAELENLKKLNRSPNTKILGRISEEEKVKLIQGAKAFIHPQLEDFGIALVEAEAAGTPVIAYGKGGALETVTTETGILFEEQTVPSLIDAIERFNKIKFDHENIKRWADTFSEESFLRKIKNLLVQSLN